MGVANKVQTNSKSQSLLAQVDVALYQDWNDNYIHVINSLTNEVITFVGR